MEIESRDIWVPRCLDPAARVSCFVPSSPGLYAVSRILALSLRRE